MSMSMTHLLNFAKNKLAHLLAENGGNTKHLSTTEHSNIRRSIPRIARTTGISHLHQSNYRER
jgi:hypothetical protein